MNAFGSVRSRAISKLMTPSTARAGATTSRSAAIICSTSSGVDVVVGQACRTPVTQTRLRLRPTRAHEPFGLSFGEQAVQQIALHRKQGGTGPRGRADLVVHVQYMVVDGALGEAERL